MVKAGRAPGGGQGDATKRAFWTVLVAGLGYFVDIYDLILFAIVRVKSLTELGVSEPARLLDEGITLLNMQMLGMLLGGILWGVLGDKRGRLSVLFGSILLYSLANVANGFVTDVSQYAALRFIAGIGLAGELGAGVTLVAEIMHRESRGYGTTIVATLGILGAIVAALVGDAFSWRTAYFVGGGLGLALLVLRVTLAESGMFERVRTEVVSRGNFLMLFTSGQRLLRYLSVIFVAVPIWYVVGILITFSPDLGVALGMAEPPKAGDAVMYCYIGLAVGDLTSGVLSQRLRSRRKVVGLFLVLTVLGVAATFAWRGMSQTEFYVLAGGLGFATGYWAVFVTMAAEQFGTNLRATAATTAPNFVRGAVALLTTAFKAGKGELGIVGSAAAVGAVTLALAFVALLFLPETYGKDLDFTED